MNLSLKKFALASLSLCVSFGLLHHSSWAQENSNIPDKITIVTEAAYPPFSMINDEGNLTGFDVDIAHALCLEMNVTCSVVAGNWDNLIPGVVNGDYDAIIASLSITEDRKKDISFSDHYYSNYLRIVAPTGSSIASAADLAGKTVGVLGDSTGSNWLQENSTATAKIYETQTDAFQGLKTGEVEALIADVYPAHEWLALNDDFEFVGRRIDTDDKIAVGLRKDDADLRTKINAALKTLRANGTYAEINAKYFPFDIY